VCGAGDTVLAVLGLKLLKGNQLPTACQGAALAGAIQATRLGTSRIAEL
jgi:bifunctional ADP-heptose synthase (sugar kinase/adenylyltransferase)